MKSYLNFIVFLFWNTVDNRACSLKTSLFNTFVALTNRP